MRRLADLIGRSHQGNIPAVGLTCWRQLIHCLRLVAAWQSDSGNRVEPHTHERDLVHSVLCAAPALSTHSGFRTLPGCIVPAIDDATSSNSQLYSVSSIIHLCETLHSQSENSHPIRKSDSQVLRLSPLAHFSHSTASTTLSGLILSIT